METVLHAVIAIESLAVAIAIVAILLQAIWATSRDRGRRQRMRSGGQLLRQSLDGPIDEGRFDGLCRLGRRTQVRLLAELAPSLGGAQRTRLHELAVALGLEAWAVRRCRSRWWWRRLYATRILTLIDGGEEVMPTLIHDPDQLVRTQVAEWAALHPSPAILVALVGLLDDPKRIARFAVHDTLLRIGPPAVGPLLQALARMGPRGIASGLLVAAGLNDQRFRPAGLSYAAHPEPPVRAAAATVLGALGGDAAEAALRALLADPVADVRRAATRGLGRPEYWASAAALLPLLGDPTWPVRRASALALSAMGAPGSLMLRTALVGRDRFAADIAGQTLEAKLEEA